MNTPWNVAVWVNDEPTRLVMRMPVTTSEVTGVGDTCGVVTVIWVPVALTDTTVAGRVVLNGAPSRNSTVTG